MTSPIHPIPTPIEKKRIIEKEFQDLSLSRLQAKAAYEARIEAIDDRELQLHDMWRQVHEELEAIGEEV